MSRISRLAFAMLICLPLTALAADDGRVSQLEQDVRDLKRQVQSLSRKIDELQRVRPEPAPRRAGATAATADASTDWMDAAKWQKVRLGMSELEVLNVLGPPTSMREDSGARVLLYAMEIGSSGFLSGSVTLRNRVVTDIENPAIK